MGEHRKKRVSEVLREFLAVELGRCGDPRLASITVTGIDMSNDLKTAWVYWASHPDSIAQEGSAEDIEPQEASAEEIKAAGEALDGASKLLRRRIGEQLKLRYTPALRFKHDESLARGFRIDHILSKI